MSKLYILSFDPHLTNAQLLHNLITTMPSTIDWWHYLGSTYLIVSDLSAVDIQGHINTKWVGNFLVVEVNNKNSGGWLPKVAWDWINSK